MAAPHVRDFGAFAARLDAQMKPWRDAVDSWARVALPEWPKALPQVAVDRPKVWRRPIGPPQEIVIAMETLDNVAELVAVMSEAEQARQVDAERSDRRARHALWAAWAGVAVAVVTSIGSVIVQVYVQ